MFDYNDVNQVRSEIDRLTELLGNLIDCGEDNYPNGTVITFVRPVNFKNGIIRKLTYAALKAGDAWYVTGSDSPNSVSWKQLVEWARPENLATRKILTESEESE